MNSKLFFVIFACAVVILSVITICVAPIINNVGDIKDDLEIEPSCKPKKDKYDFNKKHNADSDTLDDLKRRLNKCNRHKAMNDLEYTSLIMDLVLGVICCLLGLLHYFDQAKYFEKITGIIGIASGAIGFILTIIYVGYSGYIFDNEPSGQRKLYSNGARFKFENSVLVFPFDEEKAEKNEDLMYAKFKELGKKQYNYNSKFYKEFSLERSSKYQACTYYFSSSGIDIDNIDYLDLYRRYTGNNCEYVWIDIDLPKDSKNKYLFDRWLTSIIFSSLIFACDLGLALFGFLLFKGSSSGTPLG